MCVQPAGTQALFLSLPITPVTLNCVFEVFCLYWTVRAFGTGMVFLHFCTPVTDTYNREHPWGRPFLVEVPSGPTRFPGEGPLFHVLGLGL